MTDRGRQHQDLFGQRHRRTQPERLDEPAAQRVVPAVTGDPLDEMGDHDETGVAVGPALTGREQRRHVAQQVHQPGDAVIPATGVEVQVAVDTADVAEQLPRRYLAGRRLVGQHQIVE